MFRKFQLKKINNRIERALHKRDRSGANNPVKSIGILYNANVFEDKIVFKELASIFKISEDKINYLGLVTFDKKQASLPKDLYTKKDFSWSGDIKSANISQFVKNEFDVLICYYDNENPYLDMVVAQSKAHFKVGFSEIDERLLDLILAVEVLDMKSFNSETLKYLKILGKL